MIYGNCFIVNVVEKISLKTGAEVQVGVVYGGL